MKNILMAAASTALLIVASSVAYYFVIVLPQQQSQSQQEAAQRDMEQQLAKLNAYEKCTTEMAQKGIAYISQQCPNGANNIIDYWKCSQKVQQTAYYQQHFTPY